MTTFHAAIFLVIRISFEKNREPIKIEGIKNKKLL